jgi:hypothetical protein
MTWFFIMVPLMLVAAAIATVPVLYHSVREHNLINHGAATRPRPTTSAYSTRQVAVTERHKVAA